MEEVANAEQSGADGASGRVSPRNRSAAEIRKRSATENIEQLYEWLAPVYDHVFGRVLEPGRRSLAQAAATWSPKTILEVGIGSGRTLPLYPATSRVVGIDLSQCMLRKAQQQAVRLPDRDIELAKMNGEDMTFADASYDCVTVPYVLSVTPSSERMIREIRRVCKPNGIILIVNHFSGSRFWWLLENLARPLARYLRFDSRFRYEDHILVHSWQVLSSRPVNLFGLSKLIVLRNTPDELSSHGGHSHG